MEAVGGEGPERRVWWRKKEEQPSRYQLAPAGAGGRSTGRQSLLGRRQQSDASTRRRLRFTRFTVTH